MLSGPQHSEHFDHAGSVCFVVAGVLETTSEQDRDAIKKAKILYNSCMNESKLLFKSCFKFGLAQENFSVLIQLQFIIRSLFV